MKLAFFVLVTLLFTTLISNYKQAENSLHTSKIHLQASESRLERVLEEREQLRVKELKRKAEAQKKAQEAKKKAKEPPSIKPSYATTSCIDGINQAFPPHLREGAKIVQSYESGGRHDAIGAVNWDGSRDYGCFQINSKAHAGFFATQDWRDPVANAKYAYQLYTERGNWTAWYAVQGILW